MSEEVITGVVCSQSELYFFDRFKQLVLQFNVGLEIVAPAFRVCLRLYMLPLVVIMSMIAVFNLK